MNSLDGATNATVDFREHWSFMCLEPGEALVSH